jgi:hypothetical protein
LSDVATIPLSSLRPILSLTPVSFITAALRLLHRHFDSGLARVARSPPLDARLHVPFVTSPHRSILGVTFAADSALLNQCPCSAFIGRATPLSRYSSSFTASQHSHFYSLLALTMILSAPVLGSLMSPLSRAFIITSSKYRLDSLLTSPSVFGCYPHSQRQLTI